MAITEPTLPPNAPQSVTQLTEEQTKLQQQVHEHFAKQDYKIPGIDNPELIEAVSICTSFIAYQPNLYRRNSG